MKLKLVRHLWDVDSNSGLDHYLSCWRKVSYEGAEFFLRLVSDISAFYHLLEDSDWTWIPQMDIRGVLDGGSVHEHLDSLRQPLERCLDFQPFLFNAQSRSDAWSLNEAEELLGATLKLEEKVEAAIVPETHRICFLGNPGSMRPAFERFTRIKLTWDFSHGGCVAEPPLDDCGEINRLAAQRRLHLHACLSFDKWPQASDPCTPEWPCQLVVHETWWDQIRRAQEKRGLKTSTLTPKFSPAPYLHNVPCTRMPKTDLSKICDWTARRQRNRFDTISQAFNDFDQRSDIG